MATANRFRRSVRIDEMDRLEQQLAKQIQQLGQQHNYHSKHKLKTEPSVDVGYSTHGQRRVLQLKPATNKNRCFKVSEIKVSQGKKPIKHQFSSLIMGNREKQNRPVNVAKPASSIYGHGKKVPVAPAPSVPAKHNIDRKMPHNPPNRNKFELEDHQLCRNLLKQFEPETLFADQHESKADEMLLFDDDSLRMDDSLDLEIKQTSEENSDSIDNFRQLRKLHQSTSGKLTKRATTLSSAEMECTFKPVILPKSKKIAERLAPSFDRLTTRENKNSGQGYRKSQQNTRRYSRERINTLSRPKQLHRCETQREEDNCSFKPILSRKSMKQFDHCMMDVVGRNELWLMQKENKINKLREEEQKSRYVKEAEAQRVATFSSNQFKNPSEVELSKFMKEGLASYFERLQQASQMKRRVEQAEMKYSGKGWSGTITKAQEFRLSGLEKDRHSSRPKTPNKSGENQYERAIKELHEKIQKLQI